MVVNLFDVIIFLYVMWFVFSDYYFACFVYPVSIVFKLKDVTLADAI